MNSDDLIASLAQDLAPVPRHALGRRLGLGIAAGCVVTLVAVGGWLGFRPDLAVALHGGCNEDISCIR